MGKQNLMDNNFNKQHFLKLIEKYLDGKASLDEIELLNNYCYSFQQDNAWDEFKTESDYRDRMLENILKEIKEDESHESKIIRIFRSNLFKLSTAAAVLLIMFSTAVYNSNIFSKIQTPVNKVVFNDIKIGTDKATLTTEDGSVIVLEKGKSFKGQNAASNGEKLVYNSGGVKTTKAYNYLSIPRGGRFYLKLSDGTEVWLNSESKIKYPIAFTEGETRNVELVYGEAYFEVSPSTAHKGSHFNVKVKDQNVEVLGTQFNVKAYEDEGNIFTTLVEGKVELSNNKHVIELHPNQQTVLNKSSNIMKTKSVDVYDDIAWKDGVFSFQRKSLKEITLILSRWYDIDVVFKNSTLQNKGFNGLFEKNQGIVEILETFKKLGAISKYTIREKTVVLE
ncbi:FecR domain-containing protein [Flavobacterium pectinovorum]|uniref:FecR domain-containing protein n=1 Tax=Flavobacterium pectinovorum TaxID=29533 RepID=UPI001FAC88B6|nr:FecR domain-containing protein [Flavobacterium pectinovorum]MCI9845769.1 FecR domain-containing protein [Flavobacterium pectinovorum]